MLNEIQSNRCGLLSIRHLKEDVLVDALFPRIYQKNSLPVRIHAILSNAGWLQRSCFYQGG